MCSENATAELDPCSNKQSYVSGQYFFLTSFVRTQVKLRMIATVLQFCFTLLQEVNLGKQRVSKHLWRCTFECEDLIFNEPLMLAYLSLSLILIILHFAVESITAWISMQRHTAQNKDFAIQGSCMCTLDVTHFYLFFVPNFFRLDVVQLA